MSSYGYTMQWRSPARMSLLRGSDPQVRKSPDEKRRRYQISGEPSLYEPQQNMSTCRYDCKPMNYGLSQCDGSVFHLVLTTGAISKPLPPRNVVICLLPHRNAVGVPCMIHKKKTFGTTRASDDAEVTYYGRERSSLS